MPPASMVLVSVNLGNEVGQGLLGGGPNYREAELVILVNSHIAEKADRHYFARGK